MLRAIHTCSRKNIRGGLEKYDISLSILNLRPMQKLDTIYLADGDYTKCNYGGKVSTNIFYHRLLIGICKKFQFPFVKIKNGQNKLIGPCDYPERDIFLSEGT